MLSLIFILAIVVLVCYELSCRKVRSGPMYPKFRDELNARRRDKTMPLPRTFICPWCRTKCSRSTERVSWTTEPSTSIFCDNCRKKIHEIAVMDKRPDFVDEYDWLFFSRYGMDDSFWVIYRDYQLNDIKKEDASKLVHSLVPEDFGKIRTPKYRNDIVYEWHDINSHVTTCSICGRPTHECICCETYKDEMDKGKYPRQFKPYLATLRELNPHFVLLNYYKENGKIFTCLQERTSFSPRDFITLNDWQTLQYLSQLVDIEQYAEEDVSDAIESFINLIVRDLEIQIKYYEMIKKCRDIEYPLLPSVNVAKISERESSETKTTSVQLLAKYVD